MYFPCHQNFLPNTLTHSHTPQDVLRNWHSREAKIVQNMQDLVDNAFLAESAIERGM